MRRRRARQRGARASAVPTNSMQQMESANRTALVVDLSERSRVNLRALETVGIVNVNGFPLREKINRGDGSLAVAIAGLLGAAKGEMRCGADGRGVDVDDARVDVARGVKGLVDVARVNGRGKPEHDAVSDVESFVETIRGKHGNHRTEDLFLGDAHLRAAIPKNSGLEKPAVRARTTLDAIPSREQLAAILLPHLDVAHHCLELGFADRRPHLRRGIESVADFQLPRARHEAVHKFAVDFLVYGD